ncbi:DUF4288 domain-containing protein [Sinobacterium caligoides]|nr:DUF4288 domain-containing protein [Sinobacterium caligoides]
MEWYAVRNVFHFGVKSDGKNVFEERVVVFQAESFDEVHSKAEAEAAQYAKDNDFSVHDMQECYRQDGENLIDGYEVWSQLFEAHLSLEAFYATRYEKFKYDPENV